MPFSGLFDRFPALERAVRVRRRPVAAYGIAFAAWGTATALRWALRGELLETVPFITYYPAIILAAICGGAWLGLVSILLSAAAAWYLFLPPPFSWVLTHEEAVTLLLFLVIAGFNVLLVALLNAAVDRVLAQEQNVRVLIESSPNGIIVVDEHGTITRVNGSAARLFGYKQPELLGKCIEILVPESHAKHRALRESYMRAAVARPMGAGRDLSGRRRDGSEFPVEIGLTPIVRNRGRAILATVIDISERKRAVDRQQLLIRELQHRTANLFTVVQFIANRSLVEGLSISQAKEEFSSRLESLARSHRMLADAAWEGAPIEAILKQEVAAFSQRVTVTGCDLFVNASTAQHFALIFHELMTNAVKHGALSAPAGRVSVAGGIDPAGAEPLFTLRWKETGGPTVSAPTRRGFGSIILVDAAKQFGERVDLQYDLDGVCYDLVVRLAAIEAVRSTETDSPLPERDPGKPQRVD